LKKLSVGALSQQFLSGSSSDHAVLGQLVLERMTGVLAALISDASNLGSASGGTTPISASITRSEVIRG
jgi:hypothetical protein